MNNEKTPEQRLEILLNEWRKSPSPKLAEKIAGLITFLSDTC